MVKNVDAVGLRIARLAYVMHFLHGTQAHVMRTRRLNARLCARLGKILMRRTTGGDPAICLTASFFYYYFLFIYFKFYVEQYKAGAPYREGSELSLKKAEREQTEEEAGSGEFNK